MNFDANPEDEAFRLEVRAWLKDNLIAPFDTLPTGSNFGGPEEWALIKQWEKRLGEGRWIGLSWPEAYGGRNLDVSKQSVFLEEYVKAGGPTRAATFSEGMLGPTVMALGTEEQKQRFLPPILKGEEFWCQGFSEPDAGSDLANIKTKAVLDGDEWVIDGQKIWTSQATLADWIMVVTRTDPESKRNAGLSFLLVPIDQPGIELRPIRQMTGDSEFNEVFFDGARTKADLVVGGVGNGFKTAMTTLSFERGTAFAVMLFRFQTEFNKVLEAARESGAVHELPIRQKLADAYIGLEQMRYSQMRLMTQLAKGGQPGPEASIGKLFWSAWHQRLGELYMEVRGIDAQILLGTQEYDDMQYTFMFSRADTIYAGSSQVQRNIIGERVLGLPRD
ncbi:MAG: acyl-CoA dehydrogenase family protein [Acidimicrobiia bacterium]